MGQRTAPDNLGPQTETNKNRKIKNRKIKSLKSSPTGGSSSKSSLINASPNYMKPTTCSDARKERMQVTLQSPPTADKSKTPKTTTTTTTATTNNSKPSSGSPADRNTKPSKTLARKASLRPKRRSMKKNSGVALSPKRTVRRATCSSTLKDSKFPKALDLNPGGTQVDMTSVLKVCPFDYCSLNGHRHGHLHPLKRLPSARRRSLKTQRSIRLKRLSSVRKRSFRKGRRNIASGKITSGRATQGSKITPVIEEVTDDFFIEIYAKPQENTFKHINCEERNNGQELDREISKILDSLDSMEDDVECSEEETEEFDGTVTLTEIPEIYTRISFGDNLDQSSDISLDDMYADSNIPDSGAKEETLLCFHESQGHWGYRCCGVDVVESSHASPPDSEDNMSIEATHMDYEEEAGSFSGMKIETCESSYGLGIMLDLSEENDNAVDGFLFVPESTLLTGHGGQIPDRGSTNLDYEDEAAGSFTVMRIETSNSSNELGLALGLLEGDNNAINGFSFAPNCTSTISQDAQILERGLNFPSKAASLEYNDDCSDHGEEGSSIKVQHICNVEASDKHDHRMRSPLTDVLEQPDSSGETKLVVAANDKADEDNIISVLEREKSEPVNLEESDLSTGDESPDDVIHSISVEDEETGGGEAEQSNNNSFKREKSDIDDLQESELAVDDESPDHVYLRIAAEDAETGGGEDEENNINGFESKSSERDDLGESKLATDDECRDKINLGIVAEGEETRGNKAEENNIICLESKKSEQDLEESELATDGESPVNINLSNLESEKSEPDNHEESELIAGDENPDNNLRISKEDGIGNGNSKDENMIEIEFSDSYCEIYDVHQNDTANDYIQLRVKIETCSSDDAMEDSRIQNEIPDSISTDLTEEINSEDNQLSEEEELEDGGMSDDDISAANIISLENDITISTEEARYSQTPFGECNKQKTRKRIINRRKNLDKEMLRLINPRAPCFLPVKPDPEAEKVDLRHQLMDERKSAEAWMIDYALQRVVKKLAPARKRKVALLVEAFEAVMPASICESPLLSPTSGFGRPIQACS